MRVAALCLLKQAMYVIVLLLRSGGWKRDARDARAGGRGGDTRDHLSGVQGCGV